jgi:hypothetical protein
MNSRYTIIGLVIVNCALLFGLASTSSPNATVVPLVRTNAFELVDKKGVTRASISVEDTDGEVVLRLRDTSGAIRVKLGASSDGSGLVLLDESTNPGLHVLAKRGATRMTLTNSDGQQRLVAP